MARPKKDRIALNIKPDAEIMERFTAYCEEVGQTKTTAFERIVSQYLQTRDQRLQTINGLYERCDERGKADILDAARIAADLTEEYRKKDDAKPE